MAQILPTIKKWFSNEKKEEISNSQNIDKYIHKYFYDSLIKEQENVKNILKNIHLWEAVKNDKEKSYDYLYNILSSFEMAVYIPTVSPHRIENVRYLMNNPDKIIYKKVPSEWK